MSKLREEIEENYKNSLKSKDELKLKTLRLIKSAIKDKDILNKTQGKKDVSSDEDIFIVFQNLIKQRNESAEMFKKGNRENLAENELKEIEIIKTFLPKQLSEEDTIEIINEIIKKENLKSIKDMGKVMAVLKMKYSGKIDMTIAASIAKNKLGS